MLKTPPNLHEINQNIFWNTCLSIGNNLDDILGEFEAHLHDTFLRDEESVQDNFYFFDVELI